MSLLLSKSYKFILIKGALWSLATRWGIRILGFINTVVMARLITPSDYGIVAMAFLVVGLIQALMDFGAATALLRKDQVSRDEIDSAWTLKFIQGLAMALLMIAITPFAEKYFNDSRIVIILYTFAVCIGIAGLSNIGITLAQKEFNFSLDFKYLLYTKLLSVVTTILAGWWFRDYRGLVVGCVAGYVGGTILSFYLHPYRPRWNISQIKSIWLVTRWLMLANGGGFILRKGDELIAARIGSPSEFGMYNVGADLGQMAAGEVGPAVLKSFLPVLASMKADFAQINLSVLKTLRVVSSITLPLGLGLAAVAPSITAFVLGPAWGGAAQYVAIFAVVGVIYSLAGPLTSLLTLRGHTRGLGIAVWIEFIVFILFALAFNSNQGLIGLAFARILGALTNLSCILFLTWKACSFRVLPALLSISRPLLGSILMYLLVGWMLGNFGKEGGTLILSIAVGALTFSLWSLATWLVAGKPEGLESTVLEFFQRYLKRSKPT